jgi:hypothetical protein
MASERSGWLAVVLAVCGGVCWWGATAARVPPNPLLHGAADGSGVVPALAAAVRAADAAAAAGDLAAFVVAVTPELRARLAQQLQLYDRALDGTALRALPAQAGWLEAPLLAHAVDGDRAAVALARPDERGAQVLSFAWDGQVLRFDGSIHAIAARGGDAAQVAVQDAVARRSR